MCCLIHGSVLVVVHRSLKSEYWTDFRVFLPPMLCIHRPAGFAVQCLSCSKIWYSYAYTMRRIATDVWHGRSVCHQVEMSFGMWAQVASSNHVLDGVRIPPGKRACPQLVYSTRWCGILSNYLDLLLVLGADASPCSTRGEIWCYSDTKYCLLNCWVDLEKGALVKKSWEVLFHVKLPFTHTHTPVSYTHLTLPTNREV